jgi:hypothetical protein
MGFEIWAMYFESGMMYCGAWGKGLDEYMDITGDSNWAENNIPNYIDEEFCISENMAIYEQENAEESEDA